MYTFVMILSDVGANAMQEITATLLRLGTFTRKNSEIVVTSNDPHAKAVVIEMSLKGYFKSWEVQ